MDCRCLFQQLYINPFPFYLQNTSLNEDFRNVYIKLTSAREQIPSLVITYSVSGIRLLLPILLKDIFHFLFLLHRNVREVNFEIDNSRRELARKAKELIEIKSDWKYVELKYPQIGGFKSFLGAVSPTFLDEMYVKTSNEPQKQGAEGLCKIFKGTEALQVSQICASLLNEKNLNQISLGDMVYVADLLDKDSAFETVLIRQNHNRSLGTLRDIGKEIDLSKLAEIPSNYARFCWKVKSTVRSFLPWQPDAPHTSHQAQRPFPWHRSGKRCQ